MLMRSTTYDLSYRNFELDIYRVRSSIFINRGYWAIAASRFVQPHARGGIIETLGVLLLFTGLAIQAFEMLPSMKAALIVCGKLVLVALFLLITNPTTTHALAQAALWGA